MYPQLKNLSKEQQEIVEKLLQHIETQDNGQGLKRKSAMPYSMSS